MTLDLFCYPVGKYSQKRNWTYRTRNQCEVKLVANLLMFFLDNKFFKVGQEFENENMSWIQQNSVKTYLYQLLWCCFAILTKIFDDILLIGWLRQWINFSERLSEKLLDETICLRILFDLQGIIFVNLP